MAVAVWPAATGIILARQNARAGRPDRRAACHGLWRRL
jgi:hypothetical protein